MGVPNSLRKNVGCPQLFLRRFVMLALTVLASTMSITLADSGDLNGKFIAWLTNQAGAEIGPITLKKFEGMGNGVASLKPIAKNDQLIKIPLSSVICRETIVSLEKTALLSLIEDDAQLLAVFLVRQLELSASSFWAPYLALLPEKGTSAVFFTPKELRELQDATLEKEATNKLRKLEREYKSFESSGILSDSSFDVYKRAAFIVESRALTLRGKKISRAHGRHV